ncbi:MAG: hypothetical protein FJZ38_16170 [Candidatus Rokubacteria bacterium]|nr:hypothetical protein [Candidatus Rokubacteria bacterium]
MTPFMVLYALHDALVKPMPGKPMAPRLAEGWTVSPDGLTYDFVLRQGVRFHNGDLLTADDVKFSFERYRGVSAKLFKDVGRLPHVLRGAGHRRRLDRAAEISREGRRRRVQEGAGRRGAVQVRVVHARRRAGPRRQRAILAQGAER